MEHIFYINLEKRRDRKIHIEKQLHDFNLNSISERYEAIYIPHSGIIGCNLSHLNVLKIARERGYKNVLILEDDFEFIVSKEEFEKEIEQIFNNNVNFDVLCISYNLIKSEKSDKYPFLLKTLDLQTASGYIVNNHYYDTLINNFEESSQLLIKTKQDKYVIDQYWKKLQPYHEWYCTKTRIGKQYANFSDNSGKFADYNL